MIKSEEAAMLLEAKGVKPTANRILVYQALHSQTMPMTLKDLETKMLNMDKSSIFRTLTLFIEYDVVHTFEDGRGIVNYELCGEKGKCHHHDNHIHFYCKSCKRSFCLDGIKVPHFDLPEGFISLTTSFVIKGVCPQCNKKRRNQ